MNDKLNIDKVFREKLVGFSENPPEYIWDNIKADLKGKRRRKLMVWYGWAAAAAVLLFAFIGGWYFNSYSEKEIHQLAETEKILVEKKTDKTQSGTEKLAAAVTEKAATEIKKEKAEIKPVKTVIEVSETESVSKTETVPVNETEVNAGNIIIASAGQETNETDETAGLTVDDKEEIQVALEKSEPAEDLLKWEQKLIEENAQNSYAAAKTGKGWKVGVNVSPGYSSHSASYGDVYSGNMTSSVKSGNASVGGGISVQYKTGKRVSVESGVYYAQNGQKTGSSPRLFGKQSDMLFAGVQEGEQYFNASVELTSNEIMMNSTAGIIEFDEMPRGVELAANLEKNGHHGNSFLSGGELSQVFDFVEVPVYLRYMLIESKMDVELIGGINAGIVVGNNVFVDNEYGNQYVGRTRDISDFNISGTVGIGFNYALGKNFSFAVEPRVNYYLNSINRNPEVDFRPYRIGVFTGLYYQF